MKYLHWNFLRPHSFVGYWGHSLHASMYMGFGPLFIFACCEWDGLRTPGKIIAFTARPEIQSKSQILRYGQRTFCLPHRPKFFWFMPSLGVHAWTYLLDTAMGHWQFLSLSFVQLKGKHCRKPHCRNGVVDRFGHGCSPWLKLTVGNIFPLDPDLAQRIQNLALTIHFYWVWTLKIILDLACQFLDWQWSKLLDKGSNNRMPN